MSPIFICSLSRRDETYKITPMQIIPIFMKIYPDVKEVIEILSKKVDYRKLIQQEMGIDDNAKVEFVEKLYYHDTVYTFEEDNSIVEETKEKNEDK